MRKIKINDWLKIGSYVFEGSNSLDFWMIEPSREMSKRERMNSRT